MPDEKKDTATPTITVAGVTFSAEQVMSATVKIGTREVYIGAEEDKKAIGFSAQDK